MKMKTLREPRTQADLVNLGTYFGYTANCQVPGPPRAEWLPVVRARLMPINTLILLLSGVRFLS
jgi:hypothetical protein